MLTTDIVKLDEGIYLHGKKSTALMKRIENTLIRNITRPLRFEEWILPSLIPNVIFKKYGRQFANPFLIGEKHVLDPYGISCYQAFSRINTLTPTKIFAQTTVFRNEKETDGYCHLKEFKRFDLCYIDTSKKIKLIKSEIIKNLLLALSDLGIVKVIEKKNRWNSELFVRINHKRVEIANIGVARDVTLKRFFPNLSLNQQNWWSGYASIGINRILYCMRNLRDC